MNLLTGISKIFGDSNERALKELHLLVDEINDLEPEVKALSDDALRDVTEDLKARLAEGESTDDVLPEAFAAVREAASRNIGMRHYDVQLLGGMVLHHASHYLFSGS